MAFCGAPTRLSNRMTIPHVARLPYKHRLRTREAHSFCRLPAHGDSLIMPDNESAGAKDQHGDRSDKRREDGYFHC